MVRQKMRPVMAHCMAHQAACIPSCGAIGIHPSCRWCDHVNLGPTCGPRHIEAVAGIVCHGAVSRTYIALRVLWEDVPNRLRLHTRVLFHLCFGFGLQCRWV